MSTLDWIGKDKAINHHQQVSFRVLERQYSYDQSGRHDEDNHSENMIIHGENLEAQKNRGKTRDRDVVFMEIETASLSPYYS